MQFYTLDKQISKSKVMVTWKDSSIVDRDIAS